MPTKTKTKQTLDVKTVDTPSDLVSQTNLFDYSSLDVNTAKLAKESAIEIKAREKAIWENIIEIGNKLIEVKNALPHGQFGQWIDKEFDWSEDTAQKYMKISQELEQYTENSRFFPKGKDALYRLASGLSKVDEETKEQILDEVKEKTEEKGKALTEKEIKEITAKIKGEYEEKIKNLEGDCRLLQASKDWLDKELEAKNNTVENQNKQIKELNSAISAKESQLESLENDKLELDLKQRELDDLIAKEANVIAQQTLEQERQVLLKKEADLLKKEGQIKEELKDVQNLKKTAQRQKDNLDSTQEWITNFQLTNEFLAEATNELKKYKKHLQKNPDLSELEEKDRGSIEEKIKNLIVDFNDNLHGLGGAINYLNGAVVKFNNHALRVIDAEVKENE